MQDCLVLQAEVAGDRVQGELDRILGVCTTHIANTPSSTAARAVAVYDPINNGVWVKLQGRSGKNVAVSSCSIAAQSRGASTHFIMDIGFLSTLSPWMHKDQTL